MHNMAWKDSIRDLWILANRPPKEIRFIYCDPGFWGKDALSWEAVRQYRKKHRDLLRPYMGTELTPPFEHPETERKRVEELRSAVAPKVGAAALNLVNFPIPEAHLPYHEKLEEALQSEGKLSKATFTAGEHTGFIKNADNEIEYTKPLEAKRVKFEVDFQHEPDWPPVNRVESRRLPKRERIKPPEALRRAVILPDLQVPFHDEKALQVALEVVRDTKPDKVIFLGDLLDLSAWSKYLQRPEWASATQPAIDQAHQILATVRKMCPSADIVVLEGNHEARMEKKALANAQAAYGLRRADQPEGWPVLSVPYLTAMDTLDVEYVAGYPANRYWINERLQARHGAIVRSRASTARAVSDDERTSTIFGHVHRIETQYRTKQTYSGGSTNFAHTPGCLSRIDGSVPSTKSGYDIFGKPVTNYEDWQQGICVVNYQEGDAPFAIEQIYINSFDNYRAIYRGKVYEATM